MAARSMSFAVAMSLLFLSRAFTESNNAVEEITDVLHSTDAASPTQAHNAFGGIAGDLLVMGALAIVGGIFLLLFANHQSRRQIQPVSPSILEPSESDEIEPVKTWCNQIGLFVRRPYSPPLCSMSIAMIVAVVLLHHASTIGNGTNDRRVQIPSLSVDNSVDAQYEHARVAFEKEMDQDRPRAMHDLATHRPFLRRKPKEGFTPIASDNADGSSLRRFATHASRVCPKRRPFPPVPSSPMQYNGIEWPEMCVEDADESSFFIMGDYGGITCGDVHSLGRDPNGWTCKKTRGAYVKAADNTHDHNDRGRHMMPSDTHPQHLVAGEMNRRFFESKPRYVVNGGDNFYFGGLDIKCGIPANEIHARTRMQFKHVFEEMYKECDIPFFSVFGNHDFGGRHFDAGWDQEIAYTWARNTTGRWTQPGFYWSQRVNYPSMDFAAEYFMFDSNKGDAKPTGQDAAHNICGSYNDGRATCAMVGGPSDRGSCHSWFNKLWSEQMGWLETRLKASTARWKILVTHFPPDQFMGQYYKNLRYNYGVDLFVGSHRHSQEVHIDDRRFGGLNWVVVGGGGGITSEFNPDESARGRNQYGFLDVMISKSSMKIVMVNERGKITHSDVIKPLINTPRKIDEAQKAEKYAAGKAKAFGAATARVQATRAAADIASAEKAQAEQTAAEMVAAERDAADKLETSNRVAQAAAAEEAAAEQTASEKAAAEKDAEAAGATPEELDKAAAATESAQRHASEKKFAAQAAARDVSEAERALAVAKKDRFAAERTANSKASAEQRAIERARAAADAVQSAEEEKNAAENEAKTKRAALKPDGYSR